MEHNFLASDLYIASFIIRFFYILMLSIYMLWKEESADLSSIILIYKCQIVKLEGDKEDKI